MKNAKIITFFINELNYGCKLIQFAMTYILKNKFGINSQIYDTRSILNWREENFDQFDSVYLSTKKISSINDIISDQENTDFFIFPGDQIWNFECRQSKFFRELFTLSNIVKPKISYSVSDNRFFSKTNPQDIQDIFNDISKIDYISVREQETQELLQKYINKEIITTIDIVFLIDKNIWRYMAKKPIDVNTNKFNFKYVVHKDIDVSNQTLPLYSCYGNMLTKHKIYTVPEWLWLVSNCETIYTNSFHGVCFGLIFNKRIVCNNDYRINNLLSLLNVRLENGYADFSKLNQQIEKQKNIGFDFLNRCLLH